MKLKLLHFILIVISINNYTFATDELLIKAYTIDIRPYSFIENGNPSGPYAEYLKEVLDKSKIKKSLFVVPFARAKKKVLTEDNSLTVMYMSGDLAANAKPICQILSFKSVLVSRKGLKIKSLLDLKGKVIGRIRNGCQKIATKSELDVKLMDLSHADQGFELVKAGRIDAFCIVMDIVKREFSRDINQSNLYEDPFVFSEENVWIIASKNLSDSTAQNLESSCEDLKKDGFFEKLSAKYIMQ